MRERQDWASFLSDLARFCENQQYPPFPYQPEKEARQDASPSDSSDADDRGPLNGGPAD